MARKPKAAGDTKDALAHALLNLLLSGKPLGKVRVKELTDACNVDRQTFYYHFKNVQEAAQYIYESEIQATFADEGIDDLCELDWKTRIGRTLMLVEERPQLQEILTPALGDAALRKEIHHRICLEMETEFMPHLLEAGMPPSQSKDRTLYLTHMLESVLMAWLNGEIELDVPTVMDRIEEMLQDYVAGVNQRMHGQDARQS